MSPEKTIDVAAIMRGIRAKIAPGDYYYSLKDPTVQKKQAALRTETQRAHNFIRASQALAHPHLELGQILPSYERFPGIVRKFFTLCTKIIRKAVGFITRDQTIVNQKLNDCITSLTETQMELIRNQELLLQENNLLTTRQSQMADYFNQYKLQNEGFDTRFLRLEEALFMNSPHEYDEDYIELENNFRGTEADIKTRLSFYLPFLEKVIVQKKDQLILDVGCGRGEWLELLQENGYLVSGVDLNRSMVEYCKKKNLPVAYDNALEYLRQMPDQALHVITAFQVIEHLSHSKLLAIIREAFRVLAPGGMLLFETPHAGNLNEACNNFYIDPTHNRPVNSTYISYAISQVGFGDVQLVYWQKESVDRWWEEVVAQDDTSWVQSSTLRTVVETVRNNFYSPSNYAVIAIKAGGTQ